MAFLDRFLEKREFSSYEEFYDGYKLRIPENFNFGYDVVDALAKEQPDRCALVWVGADGTERRYTFRDMSRLSNKAANALTKMGVKKGDMVLIVLKRHYQFWYTITALHKLGAIAIPATNQLLQKDFVYRFNAAGVKAVIATADDGVPQQIVDSLPESPTVEACAMIRAPHAADAPLPEGWCDFDRLVEEAPDTFTPDSPAPGGEDGMLLYFTSGTSGYPKMVLHNYHYVLGHIPTAHYWHCTKTDDLHLTVADTGWGKAVWGKLYSQWMSEATVFAYDFDRFAAKDLLEKMQQYRVTTFCAPPTIYRFLIKERLEDYDLSALRYATTAGEPLNPEVYQQFKNRVGLEIHEGFGQTETPLTIATFGFMDVVSGAMGRPTPGFDIAILDPSGAPAQIGEVGEICINTQSGRPTGMFMGYYKDEELTRSVWHDGWYHTCDMAWMDANGYFWYVGRIDDVIKSSGYRIGPFEVESALIEHPAVLEAAVTGVPDPVRGQVVKATVVLVAGVEPSDALKRELQDHVKRTTAPYKYPRIVEFTDALPKTISGKIRRNALK